MEQLNICGVEAKPQAVASSRKARQATRGEFYGIKANALAHAANVKLAKMRIKLEKLQEPWLDADPMIEQALARALDGLDDLAKQFNDSAEYMNEAMDE